MLRMTDMINKVIHSRVANEKATWQAYRKAILDQQDAEEVMRLAELLGRDDHQMSEDIQAVSDWVQSQAPIDETVGQAEDRALENYNAAVIEHNKGIRKLQELHSIYMALSVKRGSQKSLADRKQRIEEANPELFAPEVSAIRQAEAERQAQDIAFSERQQANQKERMAAQDRANAAARSPAAICAWRLS